MTTRTTDAVERAHIINGDFVNTYGQHVIIVDCPIAAATLAVTDLRCTCGARI